MDASTRRLNAAAWRYRPRTQKARGYRALGGQGLVWPARWIAAGLEPCELVSLPIFLRPCPMRPRHGFIESRVCHTADEIRAVASEAVQADPAAELIFAAPIDAKASAIILPDRVTIGPGHDGATGGHPLARTFRSQHAFDPATLLRAGIRDTPYLEVVYGACRDDGYYLSTHAVQLRDGVRPPDAGAGDYIPAAVTVGVVITPTADLLAWEALTARMAGQDGVVAYHPGGSLTCHAAQHCMLRRIPYLTSRKPVAGERIEPATAGGIPEPTPETDRRLLSAAQHAWWESPSSVVLFESSVKAAIVIARHATLWRTEHPELVGWALGVLARAGAIACIGEARHFSRLESVRSVARQLCCQRDLAAPGRVPGRLRVAWRVFFAQRDKRCVDYGGVNWYRATIHTVALIQALRAHDVQRAIGRANILVDAVHNGGPLLSKFVASSLIESSAKTPAMALVSVTMPRIVGLSSRRLPRMTRKAVKRVSVAKVAEKTACRQKG